MAKEKKNFIVLIIGVIILVAGIIMLINGIKQNAQIHAEYEVAYNAWREKFLNFEASISEKPDMPTPPLLMFLGPIATFFGVVLSGVGLGIAFGKETADILAENVEKTSTIFDNLKDFGKPKNKVCNYCGSTNKPDATKCSSCGASISDKK